MTVFFFVVGLEIRREIHSGELSEARRAALPLAAAVGGMVVPAFIFVAFNLGRASMVGWAVPMATDIAFAVGTCALLGKRVTPALRILLLALAVIDDVGAVLVIALFYSATLAVIGFAVLGLYRNSGSVCHAVRAYTRAIGLRYTRNAHLDWSVPRRNSPSPRGCDHWLDNPNEHGQW
jgi:hypothetical protein